MHALDRTPSPPTVTLRVPTVVPTNNDSAGKKIIWISFMYSMHMFVKLMCVCLCEYVRLNVIAK